MRMNARVVRAKDIFPLIDVRDGVAVSRSGVLAIGWELTLPAAYTCTEAEYDEIITSLSSAIGMLAPWTIIHRQDIFTYESWHPPGKPREDFLSRSDAEFFSGKPYLVHRSYLYLYLSTKGMVDKSGKTSGLFGLGSNIRIPERKLFDQFVSSAKQFISMLNSSGRISLRMLDRSDWLGEGDRIGVMQRTMMLGEASPVMSDIALAPDAVRVKDRTAVCYVISESDQLPTEISSVHRIEGMSSEKNVVNLSTGAIIGIELDCEHIVNQYIVVPQKDEVLRKLDAERKKMSSGLKSSDNRVNSKEIFEYLDDAYKYGLVTIKAHTNIFVWGEEDELQDISAKISTAISVMGIRAVRNLYNTPILYYASIPGAGGDLSEENMMKMELISSLCLGIYETFPRGIPGGTFSVCDRMRLIPLEMDAQMKAQEMGLVGNYNLFVIGGSGTGKSYFMNNYMQELFSRGQHNFIIDNGDSYQGLCELIHEESGGKYGRYMTWDMNNPPSFNPFVGFTSWINEDGSLKADENGVNFIISILETIFTPVNGWRTSVEAILKQTIIDFIRAVLEEGYTEENLPILDDYHKFLGKVILPQMEKKAYVIGNRKYMDEGEDGEHVNEMVGLEQFDINDFRVSMTAYIKGGEFGFLLNDRTPKDLFNDRFIVLEVSKIADMKDKMFYPICILCVMNAFELKMRNDTAIKNLVIEEAWKAIANDTMAPYLRGLWKTARKYSTSCIVVTQELSDIRSSEVIQDAILLNSDTRILLDQRNNRNMLTSEENLGDKDIRTLLGLTPKDIDLVLSMNRQLDSRYVYKEVFIKHVNGEGAVYATLVSPQKALAYESNKLKKAPLMKLVNEVGSIMKAITILVKKKNQKQTDSRLV